MGRLKCGMKRTQKTLPIVIPNPNDTVIGSNGLPPGQMPNHDLICGGEGCGAVIVGEFSVESAEHYFVGEAGRTIAECQVCFSKNLLSTKVRKDEDVLRSN